MGRTVDELPTWNKVWDVIAQMKPEKRAEWENDARKRGWDFPEYVVERIANNIEHRRKRQCLGLGSENETGAGKVKEVDEKEDVRTFVSVHEEVQSSTSREQRMTPPAPLLTNGYEHQLDSPLRAEETSWSNTPPVSDHPDDSTTSMRGASLGLDAFATQQLREELVKREKKRKHIELEEAEDATEAQHIRRPLTASEGVPEATIVDHIKLQSPQQPLRVGLVETSPFQPPPSGGEASRAIPNVRLQTSFATAIEEVGSVSYNSSPYSSAFDALPRTPLAVAEEQDSIPVLGTQEWEEALNSSQAAAWFTRAACGPPPSPEQLTASKASGQPTDGQLDNRSLSAWRLRADDVPPGATKLWCIKKGHVPGFHFSQPLMPSHTDTLGRYRYQIFEFDQRSIPMIVAEAVGYMNHRPEDCKPEYSMCHEECKLRHLEHSRQGSPGPTIANDEQAYGARTAGETCAVCDVPLSNARAILCGPCSESDGGDDAIRSCVNDFGLCQEQADLLRLASQGYNIFFTGAAGTGKSQVLRTIVRYLQRHRLCVEVVSPTGITALNVGGRTIHSYAGWTSKAKEFPLVRLERDAHKKTNWIRLCEADTLIIDEISMVSSSTFTRLDAIMRGARRNAEPFGGVQVIVCGDFFQLPPVKPFETCWECGMPTNRVIVHCRELLICDQQDEHELKDSHKFRPADQWAFRSRAWACCNFHCVELRIIHRQSDAVFTSILDKLRFGLPLQPLETSLLFPDKDMDSWSAVMLNPRRDEVDAHNRFHLKQLEGREYCFQTVDGGYWNRELHPELGGSWDRVRPDNNESAFRAYSGEGGERHRFDSPLKLKNGMPVILMTNLDRKAGLANGSRGTIIGFEDVAGSFMLRQESGLQDATGYGERPVYAGHELFQGEEIREFISRATEQAWPIVLFDNGVQRTIFPHCEVQELGVVRAEATQERFSLRSRTQIPLLPGWSMTIHKSQGMTLDRAIVDLSSAWVEGQVYTAISRVRSLDGLKIVNSGAGKALEAVDAVKEFYATTFTHGL